MSSGKWVAIRDHALHWRSWDDDEFLVFHSGTGDTHLLNPFAAEILDILQRSALSVAEMANSLAQLYDLQLDQDLVAKVEQVLGEFEELGLIEPVTP